MSLTKPNLSHLCMLQHFSRRDAFRYSAGSVLAASTVAPLVTHAAQGRDLPSLAIRAPEGDSIELSNGGGKFPLMSFGLQVYDDETARKLTLVATHALSHTQVYIFQAELVYIHPRPHTLRQAGTS